MDPKARCPGCLALKNKIRFIMHQGKLECDECGLAWHPEQFKPIDPAKKKSIPEGGAVFEVIDGNIYVTRTECNNICVTKCVKGLVAQGKKPMIVTGTHGNYEGEFVGNDPTFGQLDLNLAMQDAVNVGADIYQATYKGDLPFDHPGPIIFAFCYSWQLFDKMKKCPNCHLKRVLYFSQQGKFECKLCGWSNWELKSKHQ